MLSFVDFALPQFIFNHSIGVLNFGKAQSRNFIFSKYHSYLIGLTPGLLSCHNNRGDFEDHLLTKCGPHIRSARALPLFLWNQYCFFGYQICFWVASYVFPLFENLIQNWSKFLHNKIQKLWIILNKTIENKIQSNSVVTNSSGPAIFVCYNRVFVNNRAIFSLTR